MSKEGWEEKYDAPTGDEPSVALQQWDNAEREKRQKALEEKRARLTQMQDTNIS